MFKEKQNKQEISFEGLGKVTVIPHTFSEQMSPEILTKLKAKLATILEKPLPSDLGIKLNLNDIKFDYLGKKLKEAKLINDKNEITCFAPKQIVIEDGTEIIPNNFVADEIVQTGGEIDGILRGKDIFVSGGKSAGINAEKFKASNTKINTGINAKYVILDNSEASGTIHADYLKAVNAKLLKGLDIDIKENAYLDNSEVSCNIKNVGNILTTSNGTKLLEGSDITAENAYLNNSEISGKLKVNDMLETYGAKQLKGSDVSANNAYLNTGTEVKSKMNIYDTLITCGARLLESSNVKAKKAIFKAYTKLYGIFSGEIKEMDKNVSIGSSAVLDTKAVNSMPAHKQFDYKRFNLNKPAPLKLKQPSMAV